MIWSPKAAFTLECDHQASEYDASIPSSTLGASLRRSLVCRLAVTSADGRGGLTNPGTGSILGHSEPLPWLGQRMNAISLRICNR